MGEKEEEVHQRVVRGEGSAQPTLKCEAYRGDGCRVAEVLNLS